MFMSAICHFSKIPTDSKPKNHWSLSVKIARFRCCTCKLQRLLPGLLWPNGIKPISSKVNANFNFYRKHYPPMKQIFLSLNNKTNIHIAYLAKWLFGFMTNWLLGYFKYAFPCHSYRLTQIYFSFWLFGF